MTKLLMMGLVFFSIAIQAQEAQKLKIVSFTGKKVMLQDPATNKKDWVVNSKIKLPIPIKGEIKGGKYLVSIDDKDLIVNKLHVSTNKHVAGIICPPTVVIVKGTASTRGLGSQCGN